MIYIIFLLLFSVSELNAILEKGQLLKDSKRSVLLFSDNHDDYPIDDARQCAGFIQALIAREKNSMHPLHVLVEQPVYLSRLACTPKVTTYLLEDAAQKQFDAIDFRDVEIRHKSTTALMVLNTEDPTVLYKPFFDGASLVDIFNEFNHYFMRMQYSKALLKKHFDCSYVKEIFDSIFYEQQHFIETIHELNINPTSSVLYTMQSLYKRSMARDNGQKYDTVRQKLIRSIGDFSNALFNLHLMHTMATLPDGHDVALIAGTSHTDFISQALAGPEKSKYSSKRLEHCFVRSIAQFFTLHKKSGGLSDHQISNITLEKKDSFFKRLLMKV